MDLVTGEIYRCYGRIEIFSKLVGVENEKLDITRRWILLKDFYDEMWIEKNLDEVYDSDLKVEFLSIEDKNNLLIQIFEAVFSYLKQKNLDYQKLQDFKKNYKVVINGRMPKYLFGKYSSQAGKFLVMLNEVLDLKLPLKVMRDIVGRINGTIKFFVSGRNSANIRGIEKRVEKIEEDLLDLKIYWEEFKIGSIPKILDTKRENFDDGNIDLDFVNLLTSKTSKEILLDYEAESLNDFYFDILQIYPELKSKVGFISGFYPIAFKLK